MNNIINFPSKNPKSNPEFVNLNELTPYQLEGVQFHFEGHYWVHKSKVEFERKLGNVGYWIGAAIGMVAQWGGHFLFSLF